MFVIGLMGSIVAMVVVYAAAASETPRQLPNVRATSNS
jgi:hypothetical protein